MKRILVIQCHPNKQSYCQSLAEAYVKGAKEKNDVELKSLSDLVFDPILRFGFQKEQALENDLMEMQKKILWSQHIVWIYPVWWGGQPALLKGFIDRTLLPEFAFKYVEGGLGFPEKLLKGKTSEIILTLDTPYWFYKWIQGAPGIKIMKDGILGFCGIKLKKVKYVGPLHGSKPQKRQQWISEVEDLARN